MKTIIKTINRNNKDNNNSNTPKYDYCVSNSCMIFYAIKEASEGKKQL